MRKFSGPGHLEETGYIPPASAVEREAKVKTDPSMSGMLTPKDRLALFEEAVRRIYSGARCLESGEENLIEAAQAIQRLCDDALRGWPLGRPTWVEIEAPPRLGYETDDSQRVDWVLRNVSGAEWRRLGITYGDGMTRDKLDQRLPEKTPAPPSGPADDQYVGLPENGPGSHS